MHIGWLSSRSCESIPEPASRIILRQPLWGRHLHQELLVTFSVKRAVKSEAEPQGMVKCRCDYCVKLQASIFLSVKRDSDVSRIRANGARLCFLN